MPYKWTDQETIQAYLESAGNLQIGEREEITPRTAERFENDAVFEITTVLSASWEGLENFDTTNTPEALKCMTAKLATSRHGLLRISAELGDSPKWLEAYRSEVIAQAILYHNHRRRRRWYGKEFALGVSMLLVSNVL